MKTTSNIIRRAATTLLLALLTMTAQTAWADTETVSYIDAAGNTRTVKAVALNGNETITKEYGSRFIDLAEGWYFVGTDITYSDVIIRPLGNVNLILANGCTMNIGTADSPTGNSGIEGGEHNITLTIYGQSLDPSVAGTLSYVGTSLGFSMPYYIQHSGNVSISNTSYTGLIGLDASTSVTLLGGTLTIATESIYAKAILAEYDITISGGTLSATATGSGNNVHGLYSNGTITLGWTNPADRITASSYRASTVKVADGQVLTDGSGHLYSGTLSAADISAIAGQTLRPYSSNDFSVNDAGTEYTIHTATGWDFFCDALQDNASYNHFTGKTVYLGASITVSRMAGDGEHGFAGTFDGQNNTLTFNYGTEESPADEQFVAPFVEVTGGAKFTNLTIDGDIYATHTEATDHDHAGGLIAHLFGTVTIDNCVSNVRITTTGEDGAGGFVGLCEHSVKFTNCKSSAVVTSDGGNNSGFVGWSRSSEYLISFDGCLFNGKLLMKDDNGGYNGGFVGWKGDAKTVTIDNCLYIPAATVSGEKLANTGSANFCRQHDDKSPAVINNCYYNSSITQYYGAVQGKQARSVTAGDNVSIDGIALTGTTTEYSISGITAYSGGGLQYGGKLYYGENDNVSLTLSADREGYAIKDYQVSAGTLSGSANPYTLTMPDENVTISGALTAIDWATESEGTEAAPYMIYNKDQLNLLAQRVNNGTSDYTDKYFKLGNDIIYDPDELTIDNDNDGTNDSNYEAICGRYVGSFNGHFDGDDKTVSGIRIYKGGTGEGDRYQGLFGRTGSSADIRNVTLADADITGYRSTGGIVGLNYGTVSDCHVAASVFIRAVQNGADYHGGIVGYNLGTVTNCTSRSTLAIAGGVTGCQQYGGITGINFGTLTDNLAIGAVVPATDGNTYGAICGNRDGTMARNYYRACKVASENVTQGGVGCYNRDVTDNNGAVPAFALTLDTGITTTSEPVINIDDEDYYAGTITLSGDLPDGAPEHYTYAYTVNGKAISGNTFIISADATVGIGLGPADWANEGNSGDDEDHAYIIYNKDQLNLLAHRVNGTNSETANDYVGKYFKLGNDIIYDPDELTIDNDNDGTNDSNYEAINGFNGHFDGDDKTVSGIRIYKGGTGEGDRYQGLFGWTDSSADIHNVTLADADITGSDYTGGIVGENYGTVSNCHVTATVAIHTVQPDVWDHGGIVGENLGIVRECFSAATLTNTGNGSSTAYGGIAGYNEGTMSNNLAIGAVVPEAAENNAYGAICGWSYDGTLENNYYAACTVAGVANAVGVGCGGISDGNDGYTVADIDGAVPALRDNADNSDALTLVAKIATAGFEDSPLDLGWGEGEYPMQLAGRTLYKDGSWNTLCLPFDVTVSGSVLDGDDVVVKTLADSEFADGTLTMNFSTTSPATLTAGTPYIIKWGKPDGYDGHEADFDLVNPVFTGVTVSSTAAATETTTSEYVDFVGTYQPTVIYETGDEKTNLYLGASNTLYYPTSSDFSVNAFRGYFHLKNGLTAGEPSSPQQSAVRAFALNFGEETNSIENGLLKIENEAGAWYDLSGRKLSGKPLVKGIYINNGHKVVIK